MPRVHDATGPTADGMTRADPRQRASPFSDADAAASLASRTASATTAGEPAQRWRMLIALGLGELLAMAPWFSASAVAPLLTRDWGLSGFDLPLLTVAVQLGFVAGALLLAATAAADVISGPILFLVAAGVAAAANLGFAFVASDVTSAIPFRFLTGFALAGVYPVGMKMLAGWFRVDRGFAIGVLVGALTLGSALPYLFR